MKTVAREVSRSWAVGQMEQREEASREAETMGENSSRTRSPRRKVVAAPMARHCFRKEESFPWNPTDG